MGSLGVLVDFQRIIDHLVGLSLDSCGFVRIYGYLLGLALGSLWILKDFKRLFTTAGSS